MTPVLQHTLESKAVRRKRLMAMPCQEKVRIVEQLSERLRFRRA